MVIFTRALSWNFCVLWHLVISSSPRKRSTSCAVHLSSAVYEGNKLASALAYLGRCGARMDVLICHYAVLYLLPERNPEDILGKIMFGFVHQSIHCRIFVDIRNKSTATTTHSGGFR